MQKNTFLSLLVIFFLSSSVWALPDQSSSPSVEVVHLYTPKEGEIAVHQFLFPLITPYLQNVVSTYNEAVKDEDEQVHKVFVSEIFRNPDEQRKNNFEYITRGQGLLAFLKLYDRYNDQFVTQFLHIVLPIESSSPYKKSLLGHLNATLDKVLKSPFDLLDEDPFSRFLSNQLKISNPHTFSSVYPAMLEISEDASIYYDLNPAFIQSVKDSLRDAIHSQYPNLSQDLLDRATKKNYVILLVSEIFSLIQKDLKKQGEELFSNPTIGKDLSSWFKDAPAFSQHGLMDVPKDQLSSLEDFLKTGHTFRIAVDLGMKTNKTASGKDTWNQKNPLNTLPLLKNVLLSKENFVYSDYRLQLIPEHLFFSSSEDAVHIELAVSSAKNDSPVITAQNPPEDEKNIQSTQIPDDSSDLFEDANMDKNFELPNEDSKTPGSSRNLNVKTYHRLLGHADTGSDKDFENTDRSSVESKSPQISDPTPDNNDPDLDSAVQEHLGSVEND